MATNNQNLSEKYEELLKKSRTSYDPGVKPTKSDINLQKKLLTARSKERMDEAGRLKEEWYGTADMEEGKSEEGRLSKALGILGMPVHAMVGGAEALLGRGTEKGIANIPANVREEGSWGDLIRGYNVNNMVAAPVGFALDVATDPFSWMTGGATTAAGKTFLGARASAKAGEGILKGAKAGAKSGLLSSAERTGRVVPGLQKRAFKEGAEDLMSRKYRELSAASVKAKDNLDEIMGSSILKQVEDLGTRSKLGDRTLKRLEEFQINKKDIGKKAIEVGRYSPGQWIEKAMAEQLELNEKIGKSLKKQGIKKNPIEALLGEKIDDPQGVITDELEKTDFLMKNPKVSRAKNSKEVGIMMGGEADKDKAFRLAMEKELNRVEDILDEAKDTKTLDKFYELRKDKKKEVDFFKTYSNYKIDQDGYDKYAAKVLTSDKGRAFFRNYAKFIGAFKNMKIGLGLPATGTNAVVGNLVMTSMIGVDIANTAFFGSMKDAMSIIKGKNKEAIAAFLDDDWRELLSTYPRVFQAIFGINPKVILSEGRYIDELGETLEKAFKGSNKTDGIEDVKQLYEETIGATIREKGGLNKTGRAIVEGESSIIDNAASTTAGAFDNSIPSTFLSQETFAGPYGDFLKGLEKMSKGKDAKPFYGLAYKALTGSSEIYDKFDQTYKLGLALHLSKNGVSEPELYKLGKRFSLPASDVTQVKGRNIYKLSPMKAMEVANETYMNYAAMPGFVQAMRTLPVVGSPFFSFAYGMTGLTAKTAVNNPAFFNKVQFLLSEISGAKSPLEKEALQSKYYSWLDRPGMVKVPFFEENPVYLNMENMIPYYTMNVFQPASRDYESRFGSAVANMVDSIPFLKTPEGQVMFDYFIQPLILQGEQPKGMFNQPLWTKNATFGEKAGRTLLAAGESVMPTAAGWLGQVVPADAAKYVPSYRMRQLANAREGKTSLGIPSSIPAQERASQVRKAMAGWPMYQVKLKYNKE